MAPDSGGPRVAAVMAAYNRRELTLACLRSLRAQRAPGVTLDAFVLDDASTDGTGQAIAEEFPEAALLRDTARRLRERGGGAVIVAGSTRDPDSGELTYGGLVRPSRWRRLRWELVEPAADQPRPCETISGNTVLISRAVVRRVGNIDPAFVQQMGDHDYGLRARAAGCSVWIAPGTLGTCAPNLRRPPGGEPFLQEWQRVWSTKELLPGPWAVFSRRWAGRLWPVYWLSPYLRAGFRLLRGRLHARRTPTRAG